MTVEDARRRGYTEAQIAAMVALARALGCTDSPSGDARAHALPDRLYYDGNALFVEPPVVSPRDETQAATMLEREAAWLRREDDARRRRFFAGRYSVRLGRVVRVHE